MQGLITLLAVVASCVASDGDYLLPGNVLPTHYDLSLAFDVSPEHEFPFYGLVKIDITALKPTSKIILHAQGFETDDDKIQLTRRSDPNQKLTVSKARLNDTFNFFTMCLDEELAEQENYTLTIPFYGKLKNDLDGVYVSNYVDKETNVKEYLITTQFEAISARKGFPCFDEPMYKATFKINIAHHKDYTAISNMPLESSSDKNPMAEYWPWNKMNEKFKSEASQFTFDQFQTSVPMSTYLLAFVVSKFSYVESPKELSDTKFRIWARKDAISQTAYASEIGPKVLTHYEKFFNVSFPLPKQDMIAIPDFSAGAMENWGLITYRETALLFDEQQSSFMSKERIAEVIAHELAHQWFGNLVTMKWWSDLWLNEGFATFVASLGMAAVEPTWQARDVGAAEDIRAVWAKDSLASSHPVSVPLDDPKRISEIFDDISYRKGSVLIRMMTLFLGEDIFRKGIYQYLTKYSYKNAEQDDLWEELTQVSQQYNTLPKNVTVKKIMDTWTKQTGYPLLTVVRDYTDRSVTVRQKRYLALGSNSKTAVSWWVPLRTLCQNENPEDPATTAVQWLSNKDGTNSEFRFEHSSGPDEWLLFNVGLIAPYRVNYDQRNWKLLVETLNSDNYQKIPNLSRVQLLADSFELAWSGILNYTITLELANYLSRETEFNPLDAGLSALGRIEGVLLRSAEYGAFLKYVRKLVAPAYERAGGLKAIRTRGELLEVKKQVMLTKWACHSKVPGCEESAVEMFNQWMEYDDPDESNPIPLDIRRTVYCVSVRHGDERQWRFLLERMRRSNVASARVVFLSALTCTRELWLLQQFLEWSIQDGSEIRRQDAASVITGIARSTVGYYLAKEFVYARVEEIHKAFNGNGRRLGGIIRAILDQFTTDKDLEDFLVWREKNEKYLDEAKLSIDQAIELAKVNIGWLKRNKGFVIDRIRELSAHHETVVKSIRNIEKYSFLYSVVLFRKIPGKKFKKTFNYLVNQFLDDSDF